MPARRLFVLAFGACVAAYLGHAVFYRGYVLDDAYISFRYASNWASGNGPVYNLTEHTEGYTSFLWVALLALLARVGLPVVGTAQSLGVLLSAASLILLPGIARRIFGSAHAALIAAALAATSGIFVVNSIEGMETPLFMFLTLACLLLLLREMDAGKAPTLSMAAAAALSLTRPDGALVPAAMLALGAWRRGMRWLLIGGAIVTSVLIAHLLWRLEYYGYPLPNTYYAKGGGSLAQMVRGLGSLDGVVQSSGGPLVWLLALVPCFDSRCRRAAMVATLVVALRAAFVTWSGDAWIGTYRFMAPMLPLVYLLFGGGCLLIAKRVAGTSLVARNAAFGGVAAATMFLASRNLAASELILGGRLAYARGLAAAHIALGRELEHSAPRDAILSCQDAGALPYYSGLVTIDQLGLTDTHIAHLAGAFMEKLDVDYVLAKKPDYLVLLSRDLEQFTPLTPVDAAIERDPRFESDYERWRVYTFNPQYHLWVFRPRASESPDRARREEGR